MCYYRQEKTWKDIRNNLSLLSYLNLRQVCIKYSPSCHKACRSVNCPETPYKNYQRIEDNQLHQSDMNIYMRCSSKDKASIDRFSNSILKTSMLCTVFHSCMMNNPIDTSHTSCLTDSSLSCRSGIDCLRLCLEDMMHSLLSHMACRSLSGSAIYNSPDHTLHMLNSIQASSSSEAVQLCTLHYFQ